jgi:hypothetical protein
VILDGKDIDASTPRGWGMWFGNIASGHVTGNVIAHNVRGTAPLALQLVGNCRGDTRPCIGVHDLLLEGNVICDWGGPLRIEGDARQLLRITLSRNDIVERSGRRVLIELVDRSSLAALRWSGNRLSSLHAPADAWVRLGGERCSLEEWLRLADDASPAAAPVAPPDPERDIAAYGRTLGAEDGAAAFLAGLRAQSRAAWRPEYTAAAVNRYVRAGFGLASP